MKQLHHIYKLNIDSVPTAAQIEAEFEVVLAQLAAFTPTPELTRVIIEEMVNRIARQISFKINAEPALMGMDGEHGPVMEEIGMSCLEGGKTDEEHISRGLKAMPARSQRERDCILTAGIDVQNDHIAVGFQEWTLADLSQDDENTHKGEGVLIKPDWMNKAQDSLKDLLYKSASTGNTSINDAEVLSRFVYHAFFSLNENNTHISSIINTSTRLSRKSSDFKGRLEKLYEIVVGEKSTRSYGSEGVLPRSPITISLDRFNDVSDDISAMSRMLDVIEAKISHAKG